MEYENELTLMISFIQESAAQDYDEPLVISAVESLSGLRSRALLSSTSSSPTLEEIAAMQEDYYSDSDASTVLLEEGPRSPRGPPVPQWCPTTAKAVDPIFGHAEPIIVSEADP